MDGSAVGGAVQDFQVGQIDTIAIFLLVENVAWDTNTITIVQNLSALNASRKTPIGGSCRFGEWIELNFRLS